jgi:hypothetical protein
MITTIILLISLLLLAYLNVSALIDIECTLPTTNKRETILRFGWVLFLLILFVCVFITLLWENT